MSVSLLEGFCNFVQLLLKHVSSLLHNFLAGQLPPWLNVKDETVRIVFHFNQIVADAVTGIDQGRGAYQVPVYLPVFSEYLRRILVTKLSKFFRIVMDSYLRKICIVHMPRGPFCMPFSGTQSGCCFQLQCLVFQQL